MTSRRLHRAAVVEAAAQLVDTDGWRSLTMTEVARKLGVQGPTLYGHVDSIEALLGAVQIAAHGQLAQDLQRAAVGRVGAEALRAMARALRSFAREHPGLYELATSELIDRPGVHAAAEPSSAALAAVIGSFGVESTLELQVNCLATLHGVLALDRARFFGEGLDVDHAYERAIDMVVRRLEDEGSAR